MATLEFPPSYLPIVQQQPDGQWYMTPQWYQWFQSSQNAANSTSSVVGMNAWATGGAFTLTAADQVLAHASIRVPAKTSPNAFIYACIDLKPAVGAPTTFEDCVFSIKDGTTLLTSVTQSVYGDENTVVFIQAYEAALVANRTYTFNLTGRRLTTPTSIAPIVNTTTLSVLGTSS